MSAISKFEHKNSVAVIDVVSNSTDQVSSMSMTLASTDLLMAGNDCGEHINITLPSDDLDEIVIADFSNGSYHTAHETNIPLLKEWNAAPCPTIRPSRFELSAISSHKRKIWNTTVNKLNQHIHVRGVMVCFVFVLFIVLIWVACYIFARYLVIAAEDAPTSIHGPNLLSDNTLGSTSSSLQTLC